MRLEGHLTKQRLINSLAAEIDESAALRKGTQTTLPYEISPILSESHTDTEESDLPVTDTDYGNVTDIETPEEEQEAPEPRQVGRPRGEMRQRILRLLGEHPEGLSAEQIRAYLQPERPLGDTLQGMRKQQKVRTRGTGKKMRYFVT